MRNRKPTILTLYVVGAGNTSCLLCDWAIGWWKFPVFALLKSDFFCSIDGKPYFPGPGPLGTCVLATLLSFETKPPYPFLLNDSGFPLYGLCPTYDPGPGFSFYKKQHHHFKHVLVWGLRLWQHVPDLVLLSLPILLTHSMFKMSKMLTEPDHFTIRLRLDCFDNYTKD